MDIPCPLFFMCKGWYIHVSASLRVCNGVNEGRFIEKLNIYLQDAKRIYAKPRLE